MNTILFYTIVFVIVIVIVFFVIRFNRKNKSENNISHQLNNNLTIETFDSHNNTFKNTFGMNPDFSCTSRILVFMSSGSALISGTGKRLILLSFMMFKFLEFKLCLVC